MASHSTPSPLGATGQVSVLSGMVAYSSTAVPGPTGLIPLAGMYSSGGPVSTVTAARSSVNDQRPTAARIAQDKALSDLESSFAGSSHRGLILEGRPHRLMSLANWEAIADNQRFERIPPAEARHLLQRRARAGSATAVQKAALENAALLLHDSAGEGVDGGLVLLREARQRIAARPAEPAITPSELRRLLKPAEDKTHWIEIQLFDTDGNPVANEPYEIIAPDKSKFPGVTDADGFARIDGIVAGQCLICFTELDRDAWSKR